MQSNHLPPKLCNEIFLLTITKARTTGPTTHIIIGEKKILQSKQNDELRDGSTVLKSRNFFFFVCILQIPMTIWPSESDTCTQFLIIHYYSFGNACNSKLKNKLLLDIEISQRTRHCVNCLPIIYIHNSFMAIG